MDGIQFAAPASDNSNFLFGVSGCYTTLDDSFLCSDDNMVDFNNCPLALEAFGQMLVDIQWPPAQPNPNSTSQAQQPAPKMLPITDESVEYTGSAVLAQPSIRDDITRGAPMTNSCRTATGEDWIRYRHVITRLYMSEEYTLSQVQAVMQEKYGIHAS
jgi:Clr5-like protein